MTKPCAFCGNPMPSNKNMYCNKCSQERQRLALVHFYGCPHKRPVDPATIGGSEYFWREPDGQECPECKKYAYPTME